MEGDRLTFADYYTMPLPQLVRHPDFSRHALRVVEELSKLNSRQLENIDLMKVK